MAYLAVVASLAPLGLNLGVGLQPVFADGSSLDAGQQGGLVAAFALGLGLGQPASGDAADRWGRRPALIGGLVLAVAGALLSAIAGGTLQLLLGRFITGLGLAAALVVPRACLRDSYGGAALQRAMAMLALVFALAPALTPAVAWSLSAVAGWRAPMIVLAVFVSFAVVAAWRTQVETRPAATRAPTRKAWLDFCRHRKARRTTLAFAAIASPFFIFAAVGPEALRQSSSAGAGTAALVLGVSYLGFALGNYWAKGRTGTNSSMLFSIGLAVAVLGVAIIACTLMLPSLLLWIVALSIYAIGHGIVFPSAFALVLEDLPQQAGMATAGIGTVHMSIGGAAAWLAGVLPMRSHEAAVSVTCVMAVVAMTAWFITNLKKDLL
ncbi:MAG: MFS transporter [Pseudomonadota bacterium]